MKVQLWCQKAFQQLSKIVKDWVSLFSRLSSLGINAEKFTALAQQDQQV
jgi:hypothetical protein